MLLKKNGEISNLIFLNRPPKSKEFDLVSKNIETAIINSAPWIPALKDKEKVRSQVIFPLPTSLIATSILDYPGDSFLPYIYKTLQGPTPKRNVFIGLSDFRIVGGIRINNFSYSLGYDWYGDIQTNHRANSNWSITHY